MIDIVGDIYGFWDNVGRIRWGRRDRHHGRHRVGLHLSGNRIGKSRQIVVDAYHGMSGGVDGDAIGVGAEPTIEDGIAGSACSSQTDVGVQRHILHRRIARKIIALQNNGAARVRGVVLR